MEKRIKVRDEFLEKLGLDLTDDEIDTLIKGEGLTVEKLLENHSLSEVGTALIRADAISKTTGNCPKGTTYVWPFGCVPTGGPHQPPTLRIPDNW